MSAPNKYLIELRADVVDCIGIGGYPVPGLDQLDDLLRHLEETYPYDNIHRVLGRRAWGAVAAASEPVVQPTSDCLREERDRVGRWLQWFEERDGPRHTDLTDLWIQLDACFNPETGELEPWFNALQQDLLDELFGRHGEPPPGEPPSTVPALVEC